MVYFRKVRSWRRRFNCKAKLPKMVYFRKVRSWRRQFNCYDWTIAFSFFQEVCLLNAYFDLSKGGIEPPTQGFSVLCSAYWATWTLHDNSYFLLSERSNKFFTENALIQVEWKSNQQQGKADEDSKLSIKNKKSMVSSSAALICFALLSFVLLSLRAKLYFVWKQVRVYPPLYI